MSIIAIDPGRSKCGVAALDLNRCVLHRAVIPTPQLAAAVESLITQFKPVAVLVGNGTGPPELKKELQALSADLSFVEESHTSELARARYLKENPPQGWQRLIPTALRTPESPYDDYVAIILAERWLDQQEKNPPSGK